MANQKIGLILCHYINSYQNLPKDVRWDHVQDLSTVTTKYDYVVDQNCNRETVKEFLTKAQNHLKPGGQFIHFNGVNDILQELNLDYNLYIRKDKITIDTLSNHIKRLTKEYGFERWFIPAINGVLSTNIYFKTPEKSLLMDTLSDDEIYTIAQQLQMNDLIKLCRTSRRMNSLCKTSRFLQLLEQHLYQLIQTNEIYNAISICNSNNIFKELCNAEKIIHLLTVKWTNSHINSEYALINAARQGHLTILDRLISLGVNPATHNNLTLSEAVINGQLKIFERLMQDPRVDASTNRNEVLQLAVNHQRLEILDLLLTHDHGTFAAKPLDQNLLKTNPSPLRTALLIDNADIVKRLLQDPIIGTYLPPLLPKLQSLILEYQR